MKPVKGKVAWRLLDHPVVWLGQSVDTSSICASHPDLKKHHFLTSLGCAIRRPGLRRTHFGGGLREKLGVTGPLMIDSGGFALLMNPNAKWTARVVGDLIENIDAQIFVSLDLPPRREDSAEVRRQKILISNRNFRTLSDRFPKKVIMPVIHGRTFREIELSLTTLQKIIESPKWVGLGGIVPLLQHRQVSREISQMSPEVFIAKALSMIRLVFPKTKIHAFGAGGTRTFPAIFALGGNSADSIGWRQAAGFGSIFLPLKSQRVIKWNADARPPRKILGEDDLVQLRSCACPTCAPLGSIETQINDLSTSFRSRSIHNAWVIVNQHSYWPRSKSLLETFIGEGNLGLPWAKAINALSRSLPL